MLGFKQFLEENTEKVLKLDDKLSSHYNFNPTEASSIRDYTASSHKMNSYNWNRHNNIKPLSIPHENFNNVFDSVIHKHKTPQAMIVYSGTAHDPREMKDKKNIVHHPANLSTSLDKHIGENFAYHNSSRKELGLHIMKIRIPKGHPGAYVEKYTKSEAEHEFILPRNTKMKYLKTITKLNHRYMGEKETLHTHHMEVLPHD